MARTWTIPEGRTPNYFRQDNFTVCVLTGNYHRIFAVGVSKRNPDLDDDLPMRGEEIALKRAIKALKNGRPKRGRAPRPRS